MNIKRESAIIRQMLYLLATIRNGKITQTAEENGIKTSNLSSLLKDLEKATGVILLNRKSDGVEPTPAGRELYKLAREFEETLRKFRNVRERIRQDREIYVYVPANMKIDFSTFSGEEDIVIVDNPRDCDVAVFAEADEDTADGETTKVIIQSNVLLINLLVVCKKKDDERALALYRFLVDSMI